MNLRSSLSRFPQRDLILGNAALRIGCIKSSLPVSTLSTFVELQVFQSNLAAVARLARMRMPTSTFGAAEPFLKGTHKHVSTAPTCGKGLKMAAMRVSGSLVAVGVGTLEGVLVGRLVGVARNAGVTSCGA